LLLLLPFGAFVSLPASSTGASPSAGGASSSDGASESSSSGAGVSEPSSSGAGASESSSDSYFANMFGLITFYYCYICPFSRNFTLDDKHII